MTVKFGGVTGRLPAGIHSMSWSEAEKLLAYNSRRRALMKGLLEACRNLQRAGASHLYIDGSFVTKKPNPGDWDGCYTSAGIDPSLLDPVLLDFSDDRAAQKAKFLGEVFPAEAAAVAFGEPYLSFFQHTKDGKPKGIVAIDLGTLP
ncbi:hypothetical protein [Marivita sp.]|jgi:hypothetical protein|uniref:DUF6932 family protein n=1 Tax=Marivita sp. TaxID=2003365 RepID=UPI0026196DD8|nr:hypothetical protein [Marivita sp.]